jgi:hypothetical protein
VFSTQDTQPHPTAVKAVIIGEALDDGFDAGVGESERVVSTTNSP